MPAPMQRSPASRSSRSPRSISTRRRSSPPRSAGRRVTDDRAIIEDPSIVAISNTLPTPLHADATIAALEAGKHVLLEKPFALTAEGLRRHDRRRGQHRQDADGGACAALLGRLCLAGRVRAWRPDRQADLGDGEPAVAGAGLGRLVPRPGDERRRGARPQRPRLRRDELGARHAEVSAYGRGREARPGLWNDIHALIDYGSANGFVEGSEFMPAGLPLHLRPQGAVRRRRRRVRCSGPAASASRWAAAARLCVFEDGKSYPLEPKPGDAYENQIGVLRRLHPRGAGADAGDAGAGAACGADGGRGAPILRDRRGGRDLRRSAEQAGALHGRQRADGDRTAVARRTRRGAPGRRHRGGDGAVRRGVPLARPRQPDLEHPHSRGPRRHRGDARGDAGA